MHKKYRQFLMALFLFFLFITFLNINENKIYADTSPEIDIILKNGDNDKLTRNEFVDAFEGAFFVIDVYAKSYSGDVTIGVMNVEFLIDNDYFTFASFDDPQIEVPGVNPWDDPSSVNLWNSTGVNPSENEIGITYNALEIKDGKLGLTIDSNETLLFSINVVYHIDFANPGNMPSDLSTIFNLGFNPEKNHKIGESSVNIYNNNNINFKHIQIGEASIDPTADITGIDITGSNSYTNTMSNTTGNSYETENKVTFHHANEGINLNPLFVSPSATITSFMLGEADLSSLISTDGKSIENLRLDETKTYTMVVKDDDDKEDTYTLIINVEDPDDDSDIYFTTNQSSANLIGFGEGVDSNNYYIEVPYSVATIEVTGHKTSTSPYTNIDGNNKVSKSNLEVGDNLLGDITVKTEAGTSQVYTVYVTRLEGNSNTDFNVRISTMDDGEYIEIDGDRYDALVPEDKDQYSIDFSGFESTTKIYYSIGIDEDISSSSATLLPSSNRIISQSINKDQTREYTILSVAENEDIFQITYLYVKRAASSLAEIDEIKITENPNYNAVVVTNVGGVYRYELKDENSTTLFVNISLLEGATLEFLKDGSNVSNTISVGDLVTGNNEYTIKVIPANLDPEKIVNYTLNIVKRSSEKEVTGIKLVDDSYTEIANGIGEGEGKFIKDGDTYRISVPYEAGNTFRVTITSSLKSIIKIGSSANNDNEDTWQVTLSGITSQTEFTYFTIRDEYGAISDQFTISITRLAADDNANLSNITIDGSNLPSFNPGTLVYKDEKDKIYIGRSEDGSQTVHVLGELESDKSIVKYFVGSNEYINGQITIVNGQNTPVDIEVTAQSGRKQTYKITIVAGETNNSINNIILPGINFTFDKEQLVYNLSAPYSVESVTPSVTRGGTYSTVVGATKHALTVGVEESFTIYAVSEVGVKGVEYTFNITRADANTFNDLESLQISYNGGSPDALLIENGPTYNIYKTPVINSVTVVATITGHQGETIDGVEGNTQTINRVLSHGLNVIEITVLNEKKIAQVYKINITIADDNNEFSKLRIGNNDYYMDDFDELNTLVLDDVLYSVNELPITVTNSSNFSTTTFSGKYLPSEGIWQLDKFGNELNVITFTITSEDGQNVKTYTVKVKRLEANKIALLDNLEILLNGSNLLDDITNYTLNETKNINLRVDRGSNLVTIKAYVKPEDRSKLTELGDGVLIDGLYVYTYQLTLSDGLTSFKSFKITSEDGFTVNTFNVNILSKNNDNEVNSLKIYNGSILLYDGNFDDLILDETIPFSVNSLRFVVTKNDRYSRILLDNAKEGSEGQYEVTFNALVTTGENNTIKLRVESEIIETEATNYNSTFKSKEITITYTKNTPSDTAELDNLEVIVDGINILDGFNKDTTSYKKLLVSRDFDNVNITATPGANGSILAGSDIGVKNLNKNGVRTFTITVLAEDGISQKEYTVEIFNQNDDPSVLEITIDGEVITVEEDEFNYELEHKLPYTKTSVDVLVNTKDEFAIVTIQGQNKLSYGKNTIKVIVKGEYTHSTLTNEYFIIVTVLEPETNINLIDLSVETTDGINLPFDSGLYDPINNQYNFIITLEDSLSNPFINILYNKEVYQTLTKPDGLGFSNLEIKEIAGEINETITFFVNAEDDASQKYTITIIKNIILSDDFSIKSVSLKDNDNLSYINEFNEGTLEYDAHVLFRYKTLSLIITPNHEKANVIITGNLNNLNIGLNEVTFYVKAEDGTQGPLYKININRGEASDDTYLKEIYIADPLNGSNYLIGLEERTPLEVFNKEKPNYTINLDQSYVGKNIVVRYLLNFSEQTTERTNNNSIKSLVYGENFFDIAVYAEDKDEVDPRIYKVTIYVKYKENELKTLKVNNESVDFEDLYYETEELEANIDLSLLNPGTYKLYDSENNLITNIIDLELGDNIVTIEIYNDYGELVDTKELTIKRLESSDNSILSATLKDKDNNDHLNFNESTYLYNVVVEEAITKLNLNILLNNDFAEVVGTTLGNHDLPLDIEYTITFIVKAENGDETNTYTINILRKSLSKDVTLEEISISVPENDDEYLLGLEGRIPNTLFDSNTFEYVIELDESYDGLNMLVKYKTNHPNQLISGVSYNDVLELVYGLNSLSIMVRAEDPEVIPKVYKINIYVKYKENELKTLKVNNDSIDFNELYYETEDLEANIDLSLLNPGLYELYDSEDNLITNIIDLELGDNIVTIKIYNDYGELVDTKELTIKRLESSDNSILSATLKDKDNNDHLNFNESTYLYNVVVEEAITKLNLNILLNNDFAEVVGTTLGNHDLPLDIEYTITFIVKAENGDETNTYTINILRKSLSKDVTLEEISISVPENDDEYLLGLEGRIPNTLFDSNTFEYVIELDESYDGLNMLVKYKTNHPNQLISGVSYNDVLELVYGLNSLSIMVRAEDPEVIPKVYKINIYVKYKENELKTLKVNNDSIDFNELYYETEDLEANIDLSLLNPGLYELYDSEDNLITNIIDLELGDNIVTIKIYNDYGELVDTKELTIKRLESSDNSILSATLKDKDNNDHLNFNESTYLYNVEVEEAITKLNLGILLNNDFAEVVGTTLGNHDLPLDIKYVITFTVKAENGDETDPYTINILRKSLSKDVTLEEISVNIPNKGGEYLLGLEERLPNTLFDSNTFEYTIELDETYEGFNINVRFIKNHPNQTTERTVYNSLIELNYGRNYFDIVVYAEDKSETPSSYKVEIFVKYKDNELNSLKVNNEGVDLNNLYYETEEQVANVNVSLLNPGTYKLYDSEDNLITNILDLELGDNTLTIEIYNDYGVLVDTKVLTIKRLESSLKDITKVELIGNDNKNHLTNFNKETYKYEINVDHTINSVELIIEASDKTIIYGEGIYQLTPNIPVIITFYVEAENGDLSKEYEITITSVAPSEDTYLEEIYFRDPLNNDLYLFGLESRNPLYVYDQNQPTHVIDLDYMYENRDINLRIIKGNDGQILVENSLNVLITLAYGRNEFNVAVFAEDPDVEPFRYTIIINVKHMGNELDLLKVNGDLIDLNNLYYETEELKTTIVPQLLNEGSYKMYDKDSNLITDNLDLDLGDNVVTIEIYNDYGDLLETKELTIKRLESSDDSILSATLKDNYGKDYLSFDKEKDTYNIKVTSDIDELTLLVNPNNAFAEILGSDLGSHLLPLDNEITLTFRVKAEDGSLGTLYTINILRESLSTDTSLKEIYFRDPINSSSWLFGLETRTPEPINIYNKDNLTHTIILGKEYINRSLLVQFSKNHNNQTVTPIDLGVGNTFKLSHGRNEFSFVVTAEDEDVEPSIYVIIIDVLYLENDLTNLKINNDNIVLDNNDLTYHTELLEALISFETENLFGRVDILKDGNKVTNLLDLDYGDNELILEVYNENDELVKVYNLNIIRDESSDKNINDVTLKDNKNKNYLTFDEDVLNYDITVPYEIDKLTLDIITSNEFSQAFGDGLYELTPGLEKKIVFYVNAENGDLGKEYTINVLREFNSDNELGGLTVSTNILDLLNNDDFDPLVTTYSYELNEEHLNVSFSYISKPGQTIIGLGFDIDELSGLEHGINVFEILVSPEDPEEVPTIYAIIIEVINSNADLSELLVDDLDILLENEFNYDLGSVSSDISSINIEAILKDEFASFEIKDGLGNVVNNNIINLNPGVNVITITTLSEDKENTNTYTITIEQLLETNDLLDEINIKTNLDSYLLGGSDKNPETIFIDNTFNYSFIVDEKVTTLDISYILGSSKQSVLGDLGTLNVLHGINTYEITVYPEDPELDGNTYVIVVEQIYREIDLLELLVDGNNIYEEGLNTYTLDDVTTKVTSINILPILTNSYGSYLIKDHNNDNVLGNDVNLKFGNNEIKVILKSEDESMTKTITIKIKQVLDGKTDIDGLEVIDLKNNTNKIIYDEDITLYQVELNNSSDTVRVKVDADNSIKVYIQLEESSPQLRLNARAEFNLSAGKNTVVTVFTEAEDGSLSEVIYIDLYRRLDGEAALSDNNNLIDIVLEIPIDKVGINFNPDILEYVVKVPYSSEEIYIKGYPESKNATVHGEGAYSLSVGLNDPIYIRVQAEDGTPSNKQYKIILDREIPNTDVTLRDLYVTDLDGNLLPFDQGEFDKNNGFYSISLGEGSGINKVKIYAEKSVLSQEIYNIGERDLLGEEEGKYNTVLTVTVVAEDGSSGEYIIYVLHDLDFSSIKEVKDISIIGDDGVSYFGIEFLSDQYDYEVFVPFTVSETRLIVQSIGNVIYLDNNNNEIPDNRIQEFGLNNLNVYRFKIRSTNELNESEVYEINVIRKEADDNNLLETILIDGIEINNFDPLTNEYTYIQYIVDKDNLDILAKSQSEQSLVNGNGNYKLTKGESIFVSIVVTAENKTTNTYTLEIKYVNSNALLGELSVYELDALMGEFEIPVELVVGEFEYTVVIGKNVEYVNIKGSAEDQGGARLTGFGRYRVGDTDLTVPITVISGDLLEERTYLVTITKNMVSDARLYEIRLNNKLLDDFDPHEFSYESFFKNGDGNIVTISARTHDPNAVIRFNDKIYDNNTFTINDLAPGQTSVRISVTSEDNQVTYVYTIDLVKESQPDLLLTILLILSFLLWIITLLIIIIRKNKKQKIDKDQLIF